MAPPVVRFTHLSLPGREVGFLMFSSGAFILVLYYVFGPLFRSLINGYFNKDMPICTLDIKLVVSSFLPNFTRFQTTSLELY